MKRSWIFAMFMFTTMLPRLSDAQAREGHALSYYSLYHGRGMASESIDWSSSGRLSLSSTIQRYVYVTSLRVGALSRASRGIIGLGFGLGILLSHLGMNNTSGYLLVFLVLICGIVFFLNRMRGDHKTTSAVDNDDATEAQCVASPWMQSTARIAPAGLQIPVFLLQGWEGIPSDLPDGFDRDTFIKECKKNFVHLQAAWDRRNVQRISELTTQEMFVELNQQLQRREVSENNTDIVQINGELLGIERHDQYYLAVVALSGLVKEVPEASAEPFMEIWSLTRSTNVPDGTGVWLLAGIQQIS